MDRPGIKNGIYLSISLYIILFFVTFKWYQFSFDVDGTAYMTISERMANNDWFKSINGLWSPFNSFIASFFIKQFPGQVIIFKIINAVCSAGIIAAAGVLIKRFLQSSLLTAAIFFTLPFILLAWSHQQLAGDLLSLFLLLVYCCLITTNNFFHRKSLNLLCGIVMALAYFAKSYCLPFFLINHIIIHLWYQRLNRQSIQIKFVAYRPIGSFVVFLILVIPWIYFLYLKYNRITFSTAGTLNYNWFLGNGSSTMKDYGLLIPPPYSDSTNFWEDPFPYYENFLGPLSSFSNFLKAVKLVFHNCKEGLFSFTEISFVLPAIFVYWVIRIIKSKAKEKFAGVVLLLISSFILVAGYLLIHIETRYIWLTGFIGLILGAKILEEKVFPYMANKTAVAAITVLFIASFLISPADKLQDLKYSGKDIYEAADFISAKNINGNFTANYTTNAQNSWCTKLAFLSQNRFYLLAKNNYSQTELINAVRENNIRFYLFFYNNINEKESFLLSPIAGAAKEIITLPGKDILLIHFQ